MGHSAVGRGVHFVGCDLVVLFRLGSKTKVDALLQIYDLMSHDPGCDAIPRGCVRQHRG